MSLLTARNVTKRFGGLEAIHDLDVEVQVRSITSLIGPNGAGKTTFFNCVTGYYVADAGEIYYEDQPIHHLPSHLITSKGIARTYQNIRLFANLTALENILAGYHTQLHSELGDVLLHTKRNREEEARALEEAHNWLNFVGLIGSGDTLARNLPYGAQRRLEIARALASKPNLLLLDEPSAGMNPRETFELMALIRKLRDKLGITILLIEHHINLVMRISERILVLDFGRKIAEGKPEEIQHDAKVIEAYLGRSASEKLESYTHATA